MYYRKFKKCITLKYTDANSPYKFKKLQDIVKIFTSKF